MHYVISKDNPVQSIIELIEDRQLSVESRISLARTKSDRQAHQAVMNALRHLLGDIKSAKVE